jgi:hypothetical protein
MKKTRTKQATRAAAISTKNIPLQGRAPDARELARYVAQSGKAATPFLEKVLAEGNLTMRRAAAEQLGQLDPRLAEKTLLDLIAGLAGKKTAGASKEKKQFLAMLLGVGTPSAVKAFLDKGGVVEKDDYHARESLTAALLKQVPSSSAAQIQQLLTQTKIELESLWIYDTNAQLKLAHLLLKHPEPEVREMATPTLSSRTSPPRTDKQRHEVNRLARLMLASGSSTLRDAAGALIWTNNEQVREGELQEEACALARELVAHSDPGLQAIGARMMVRHEGLAGLEALAQKGRSIDVSDAIPIFLERWDEAFDALSRYTRTPEGRGAVSNALRAHLPGTPLDRRWTALLQPHMGEDTVLGCLVAHRHPPAVEQARALAAGLTFTARTAFACELLGESGDTACSDLLVRWLKSEKDPGAQATLRQALSRCGDASAVAAIEEIRQGQRTLDTDLFLVLREIRRRLEAPRA